VWYDVQQLRAKIRIIRLPEAVIALADTYLIKISHKVPLIPFAHGLALQIVVPILGILESKRDTTISLSGPSDRYQRCRFLEISEPNTITLLLAKLKANG
jgi:hypothetical protein